MSLETDLRAALLAVAPVTNVYAPEGSDRSAWQAGFADTVTDDQRAAAAQVLATFAELKAPRTATAKQVRYALNELGVRQAWEDAAGPGKANQAMQDWWGWTDPIIEDAAKLGRLCKTVGITSAALFDRATAE